MKIIQMKVNHIETPIGYHMERPIFSYKVTEAAGKKQSLARICISLTEDMEHLIYDSGLKNDINSIAYEVPMELSPCTRYYWNVSVYTDVEGEFAVSECSWFETGKRNTPWVGRWICSELNTGNHPIFYRDFETNKEIKAARLYICGLGLYEAFINHVKVSEECLTPYCNSYDQWLQYQSYDVTQMIEEESKHNRIEVLLGDGWYKGRFGLGGAEAVYGDTALLISELIITYVDGSIEVIPTDINWRARKSRIITSNIYDGEVYDETWEESVIYPIYLYQEVMPRLTERYSQAVKIKEEIKPVQLIRSPKEEWILDMGQNMAGWFSLRVEEPKGARIKLSFFEILQEGCYYRDNLRTAKQEYTYISDGQPHVIRPHFTYYGYRYVMVEGITEIKKEDYTGLVLYSDLEQTGTIITGNELVNRLISNALWGQKCNFIDVPTDCPQRDERLGWTGDTQVFSATACYQMECFSFYRKYLHDMYEEQKEYDGLVPDFIPSLKDKKCSSVWGDAATIIPWNLYLFYGDKRILEEQFESMKAWVDFITKTNGDNWEWRNHYHWGDWLALDSGSDNAYMGKTDTGYIATVYYYYSSLLVAKAAKIIGRMDEAQSYEDLSKQIMQEIREEYFTKKGRLSIATQTGYILALHYHLAPDQDRTRKEFRRQMQLDGDKLKTGFVGTPLLCNTLSENGLTDLAYSLVLEEGYPGWLYAVKLGATTIWERWNSVLPDGSMNPDGMNSLNHYSYGAIIEWIYRYVAGINPMEKAPGFRTIKLCPKPDYRLGKAEAVFDSPVGIYKSKWEIKKDGRLVFDFTIPFGAAAYLTLPYAPECVKETFDTVVFMETGGEVMLESGVYHIEYEPTIPMRRLYSINSSIGELMENESARNVIMERMPFITTLPEQAYPASIPVVINAMSLEIPEEQMKNLDEALRNIQG